MGVEGVFMSLTYAAQQSQNSARKSGAIVAVVLLHLGFLYAFTHGLNVVNIVKPFKDTITVFIPEEKPKQEPRPVPKKAEIPLDKLVPKEDVEPPPPVVIPAEIPVQVPTGDSTITNGVEPSDAPPARSFAIKHRVDPQYPAASRRAGEAGTVLLTVIIGPNGVPSDVQVERSSGFAALDQAAVDAVRKWRFTVASDSSSSRVQLPITFRLEQR